MSIIDLVKCYYPNTDTWVSECIGGIIMTNDKYSIFSVLERQHMFDRESEDLSNKIKQEIAKIVDDSSYEDKEEAKKIFARKVAFKLTEVVYRGK